VEKLGFRSGDHATFNVTETKFINCTARTGHRIMSQPVEAVIRNCIFIHDNNLPDVGSPSDNRVNGFFPNRGTFEDCTFTNLRGNTTGEVYIFNCWGHYPSVGYGGSAWMMMGNLVLRNCTFYFNAGSAGLCALLEATDFSAPYHLLVDGVTINNDGGQQPLIWLRRYDVNGSFQFRPNNVYNGTTLSTVATITGLGSNVIRLDNGAVPTLVP